MIITKFLSSKVLLIFSSILISLATSANDGGVPYFGYKRSVFVNILIKDNKAYVEYCYPDFMGMSNTKFDTLRLDNNRYVGKAFSIKEVKGDLVFLPGSIKLKSGEADNSFNLKRNMGYLQYAGREFKKRLKWTGEKLDEFDNRNWKSSNIVQLPANDFKIKITSIADSLFRYYVTSYCRKYNEITIKDNRLIPAKYLESNDTAEIYKVWALLSRGVPRQKSLVPYLVQFPVPILGLAGLNLNPVILAAPVVYPACYLALIGSEKLLANRILARSTYKITFTGNNGKCIIKVRNSKIIRNDFNYLLPFNFEKTVLHNANNKML
jgi:hypothetical protein